MKIKHIIFLIIGYLCLVSCGKDGAFLLDITGKTHFQKAPQGNAVNTIAAGDSMIAGFIKHYTETENFAESLKFSVATGSATAFSKWIAEKKTVDTIYKNM